MEVAKFQITPFFIRVDGCRVEVIEVRKSRQGEYGGDHVALSINYKGIWSRRYDITVRDMKDLIRKLKVEITKLKYIDYAYGIEEVERLIR